MHIHISGSKIDMGAILYHFLPYTWGRYLTEHKACHLGSLASQPALRIPCPPFCLWDYWWPLYSHSFYIGSENLSCRPGTCREALSPLSHLPRPYKHTFRPCFICNLFCIYVFFMFNCVFHVTWYSLKTILYWMLSNHSFTMQYFLFYFNMLLLYIG